MVEFARLSEVSAQSRSFDLSLKTGAGGAVEFTGIDRDHFPSIRAFFSKRALNIKNKD